MELPCKMAFMEFYNTEIALINEVFYYTLCNKDYILKVLNLNQYKEHQGSTYLGILGNYTCQHVLDFFT